MKKYDTKFAARISRIAMRVAFTEKIPHITRIMAESWKSLDEEDFEDRDLIKDAFTKLFNYHSDLAKAETDINLNKKLEEEIKDKSKEVKFWKEERKPFQKRNDEMALINKKTYGDKIDTLEKAIERMEKQIITKAEISGVDKGIDLLDDSIRNFIQKLGKIGWSKEEQKKIVNQAVFDSGYGYSKGADISRWFVR